MRIECSNISGLAVDSKSRVLLSRCKSCDYNCYGRSYGSFQHRITRIAMWLGMLKLYGLCEWIYRVEFSLLAIVTAIVTTKHDGDR